MLIAMAGLPGTGKSTLAAGLAAALGGVVLSKDVVRAALFPPPVLDYSAAQDDVAMAAVFAAARYVLAADPQRVVILDGRTFRKAAQVEPLLSLGRDLGRPPLVVECVCDAAAARARLDRDAASGAHPAGNRTGALHAAVSATAEPLTVPRLTLDTGSLTAADALARAIAYVRQNPPPPDRTA
jgi:predicted kinase